MKLVDKVKSECLQMVNANRVPEVDNSSGGANDAEFRREINNLKNQIA